MITFHYPPSNTSSGGLRPLKLGKYLRELGWESSVLTVPLSCHEAIDPALAAQIPPGMTVHRAFCVDTKEALAVRGKYPGFLAVPDRYVSWLPFGTRQALRVVRAEGIDAIYSTSPTPTAHLIALAVKAATGLPWVAEFRDPWVETEGPEAYAPTRQAVELWLERQVVRRADRIVVTTRELGEYLRERYGDLVGGKIRAVYNGYDEDDFRSAYDDLPAAASTAAASVDPATQIFTLVHSGLLDASYRHPGPLLQAVRDCIDSGALRREYIRLRFLGGGAFVSSGALQRIVAQLDLADVVETVGRVPYHEALAAITAASALLLLQSGDDTRALIPAKAFEYLRTGKPILAATPSDSATAALIREFGAGFVATPTSSRHLAEQLMAAWTLWNSGIYTVDRLQEGLDRYSRRTAAAAMADVLQEITITRPAVPQQP